MKPDVLIVAATRKGKARFAQTTQLGLSLRRLTFDTRIASAITYENRAGLPTIFNRQIAERNRGRILVFTHDDLRIDDYWLCVRLEEGLKVFDVIGVAGNRRLEPNQPAWAFAAEDKWQQCHDLSGAVSHLGSAGEAVSWYGESRQRCQLLDGVLIAVRVAKLLDRSVRFDAQFPFHFYDLDFCRTAARRGLSLGTWPIAVTHASGGSFGAPAWRRALRRYRAKWPG